MPGALRDQKRLSPLELELEVVVSTCPKVSARLQTQVLVKNSMNY